MSEMTVEQAIISINNLKYFVGRTLFDDKTISVSLSMAIKALEESKSLKTELVELKYQCSEMSKKISEQFKENEELKDSINKMANGKSNLIEENEKLKGEIKRLEDCWNGLDREFNRVCDEKHKLKEELEQSKANEEIALCQMANAIETSVELQSQISAVEVLEWLKKWSMTIDGMSFACATVDDMLENYTPQEIVDRITEYEKSRAKIDQNSNINSNTDAATQMESEKVEFRVGDKVLYKGEKFIVESIDGKDEIGLMYESGIYLSNYVKASEIEPAELPKVENTLQTAINKFRDKMEKYAERIGNIKIPSVCKSEEPQVEWVWMVLVENDGRFIFKSQCKTEEDAKRLCEDYSRDCGWLMIYIKVCRRKE